MTLNRIPWPIDSTPDPAVTFDPGVLFAGEFVDEGLLLFEGEPLGPLLAAGESGERGCGSPRVPRTSVPEGTETTSLMTVPEMSVTRSSSI